MGGDGDVTPVRRSTRKRTAPQLFTPSAPEKRTTRKKTGAVDAKRAPVVPKKRGGGVQNSRRVKKIKSNATKGKRTKGNGQLGIVDLHSGLQGEGEILNKDEVVYDVMLNRQDLDNNDDAFFLLQIIDSDGEFCCFFRWGRTGSEGECEKVAATSEVDAIDTFNSKFGDKTGSVFGDDYETVEGNYVWIQRDHEARARFQDEEQASWQYYVDDFVDGKEEGWYDYDDNGAHVVEELYHEWTWNSQLSQRCVQSGVWEYSVDLSRMTQTNVKHNSHKIRHIRRKSADGTIFPESNQGKPGGAPEAAPKSTGQGRVDAMCPYQGKIVDDYDVMLNQTNIGNNNNKFYVLQLVVWAGDYYLFTKWGRVGEPGQFQCKGPWNRKTAADRFEKQFRSKTNNLWEDRIDFQPYTGKYEIVEMDQEDGNAAAKATNNIILKKYEPCTLDSNTQELVEFIFSENMFKSAMSKMALDLDKMPLGKLSPAQIQRGADVLLEIKEAIENGAKRKELSELSSRFYQLIPHCFGRRVPPVINSSQMLQEKLELMDILSDIEVAQGMLAEEIDAGPKQPHPADVNYEKIKTELNLVSPTSEEHKKIAQYFKATSGHGVALESVWSVNREGEGDRFSAHEKIDNRKLLWHGTNVAVVAAILKGGLRIMPHSGGRVGKGIYLASENCKSFMYVRPDSLKGRNVGIMFLVEAALGKEHHITKDDWTLEKPPKGHDCIIAKGRVEPNPKQDALIRIDGKDVVVPQGKSISMQKYKNSSFHNSEYLLYKETQQRIRYILTVRC
ncbi:hypothetical protein BSKO_05350 [Bryopsis sp. KO-2023]|nr:hypothetical protein BSKO_05350 [Bryopsis sp. KO-2023]